MSTGYYNEYWRPGSKDLVTLREKGMEFKGLAMTDHHLEADIRALREEPELRVRLENAIKKYHMHEANVNIQVVALLMNVAKLGASGGLSILMTGHSILGNLQSIRKSSKALDELVEMAERRVALLMYLLERRLFILDLPPEAKEAKKTRKTELAKKAFGLTNAVAGFFGADYMSIASETFGFKTLGDNALGDFAGAYGDLAGHKFHRDANIIGKTKEILSLPRIASKCERCNKQIFGDRYKCMTCYNYSNVDSDCCYNCAPHTTCPRNSAHRWTKIAGWNHGGIICDRCDQRYHGAYFTSVDPNAPFDMCEWCHPLYGHRYPQYHFRYVVLTPIN